MENNPGFNGQAPPQYGQFPLASQKQVNPGYTPVQYDNTDQSPESFYGRLIDASNHPSEVLCRIADALFFYSDQHCSQFRGTQCIEPGKIVWLDVVLGNVQDLAAGKVIENCLLKLYDAASIPYTFNNTQTPVLDRRGYLHLVTFDLRADPSASHQQWNKTLNVLKLCDPLTNTPFPTPIPRSAFPDFPELALKQVVTNWQTSTALEVARQRSQGMAAQAAAGGNAAMLQQLVQTQRTTQTMQNAQAMAQLAQMQQAALGQQRAAQTTQTLQNAQAMAQLAQMQQAALGQQRAAPMTQTMQNGQAMAQPVQMHPSAPSSAPAQTSGGLAGMAHVGAQVLTQVGQNQETRKQVANLVELGIGAVSNLLGGNNSNGQANFGQGFGNF